jgi:hypothetical protein
MTTPFETIADHCIRNNKSDCIRDLAFSIYQQQFESLTVGKAPPLDQAALQATEKTLLSPGSLIAHTRAAEEILKKQLEGEITQIQARQKRDSFWYSVLTGIAANILYSLLLIVLFVVAKDQISTWLNSLTHEQAKPAQADHAVDEK